MMQSMFAGNMGIQAHQQAMDVEGSNVANINTVGYKYTRANFSEMLNQTFKTAGAPQGGLGGTNAFQVGLGSEVTSTTRMFKQGSIETTDSTTDMAISGDGFFVVSDDNGLTQFYTRAGNFDLDVKGNLVTPQGIIVQGWNSDSDFTVDNTKLTENVEIDPKLKLPPKSTTTVNIIGNLNSGESIASRFNLKEGDELAFTDTGGGNPVVYTFTNTVPAGANQFNTAEDLRDILQAELGVDISVEDGKFNLLGDGTARAIAGDNSDLVSAVMPLSAATEGIQSKAIVPAYKITEDVYDSLGEKHTVEVEFYKQEVDTSTQNMWAVRVSIIGGPGLIDTQSSANGGAFADSFLENGNLGKSQADNQDYYISFNDDGSLKDVKPSSIYLQPNTGAKEQKIDFNFGSKFAGLTGLASDSDITDLSQDGYASGDLADISIDQTGTVIGTFTNGINKTLAQVAVARFSNNEGLSVKGGNLFEATRNSGDATIGEAGRGGRGIIAGSSLEMSNVDLSKSLTQLIIIQRGFQASSKTISTTDTMLDNLMQMKR